MTHPKRPVMRAIWRWTRGRRSYFLVAMLTTALGTLIFYQVPLVFRDVIDLALEESEARPSSLILRPLLNLVETPTPRELILLGALLVIALTLATGLLFFVRDRTMATGAENVACAIRERLYAHLHRMPAARLNQLDSGDVVQRCTSDIDTLRTALGHQTLEIGRAVIMLVVAIPLLYQLDPGMVLVGTCLMPFIIVYSVFFLGRIRSAFEKADEAEGDLTALLQENLSGIRVVRAFARQDFEQERFDARNATYRHHWYRMVYLLAFFWSISDWMAMAQGALVVLVGAHWAIEGRVTVGTVYAFVAASAMMMWPVRNLGRVLAELGKAFVAIGRIEQILEEPVEAPPEDPADPPDVVGRIEIEHLSFGYQPGQDVLHDLSLTIEPGQTVALIGPTGSGKSTLIGLLLRLHDYARGSIRLDGVELARLDRAWVRRQFATVLQEPFLFSKTLGANISLGREGAEPDSIIEAASGAAIHQTILNFEHGYETMVGERGITLSGGQRQRVALARALVRETPWLVLDDALSAVDTQTENDILAALRRRHGRVTTLIIAHRLTTLMHADLIVVLEGGRIVQRGNHEQLIGEEGLYRRLWAIQSSLEADLAAEEADGS